MTCRKIRGAAALALLAALALWGCAPAGRAAEPQAPDAALPAIRAALLGEQPIRCPGIRDACSGGEGISIGDIPRHYNPDSEYTSLWRFAPVDLDGDGETEAVVQIIDAAGDMGGYLVLHALHRREEVAGYLVDYRWFEELKTDGSFLRSTAEGQGVFGPFEFTESAAGGEFSVSAALWQEPSARPERWYVEGAEAAAETFEAELARQAQKPDAPWYDFTPEEIARALDRGAA